MNRKEARWAIAVLVAAVLIVGAFAATSKAQPLTHYIVKFRFDRGDDQPTIDSAFAVFTDGSSGANDSGLRVPYDTLRYAGRKDSLTFVVAIAVATISKSINPSVMLCVFPSNRRTLQPAYICDEKQITHLIHSVDTSRVSLGAVATVDTAAIARSVWDNDIVTLATRTVTSSASGTGVYSDSIRVLRRSDSTAVGAGATIWLRPNGGGNNLTALTDANGYAKFSVDADTFFVYLWVVGYQPEIVPDTNKVPAANVRDTVWVVATTAGPAPAAGLTPVQFTFYQGGGDSLKGATLYYKLDIGSAVSAYHWDSTKTIDPSRVYEAYSNAAGLVTAYVIPNDSIYVDAYQTGKTTWRFWAISPINGDQLLGKDGVKLRVPASTTALRWPKNF
jgi:hypothetical protein